ncbi:hypothetical protein GCM10010124_18570 [Pilimelia terevasa]|uniref:Uncharacterized protein n=1 Tax=Pilimelia terevasa TaxID=53372 RepID=A0A8J3FIQ6_9ACTN|nr:hypothetical protein [Pilimelia terevasa]GGK26201.1 hypothetical protein GCM10010124_18570 [Pilimelia terevasa]
MYHVTNIARGLLVGSVALAAVFGAAGAAAAAPAPERVISDARSGAARGATPALARTIVHQVPRVAFTVNGVAGRGSQISRYDGRAVYFIAHPAKAGQPARLEGYTNLRTFKAETARIDAAARRAAQARLGATAAAAPRLRATGAGTALPALTTDRSWFYEHGNFGGNRFSMRVGTAVNDLTRYNMSCFLWWCTSWNDQLSSVGATGWNGTFLYEHILYQGSAIYFPPGYVAPNLGVWGWNDRASSIWVR